MSTRPDAKSTINLILTAALCAGAGGCILKPPGGGYRGRLRPLNEAQTQLAGELRRDVEYLAGRIGPRCLMRFQKSDGGIVLEQDPRDLHAAERWLQAALQRSGYRVERQEYTVNGDVCTNLAVERRGGARPEEIVLVGAHYDTVAGSPGANDNASGVAALLALARAFKERTPERTVRMLFFVNEEQPYAWTEQMGSLVYARAARQRGDRIVAMLSLDSIGRYSERKGSQEYPFPLNLLYPSTADFVAFVANIKNRPLMNRVAKAFRRAVRFPSEGLAMNIRDVGRSDHSSFWKLGYAAIMITDTADFRSQHYHKSSDTPEKIDYGRLARVVGGIEQVVLDLAMVRKR